MNETKKPTFRHELKYYLSHTDYVLLQKRLRATMQRDTHTDKDGMYFIRSLYYDDINDAAFREKLSGVDDRNKYRIRIYNLSDEMIRLECKHKEDGYISKSSIRLSRAECDELLCGNYAFLYERPEPFARSMYIEFRTRQLLPRVIVDYWREPFVFSYEDVRITFDTDIRSAYRSTDLFNQKLLTYPVAVDGLNTILEVKFNRILPTHIRMLLQVENPLRSAASKYVLCRKFEL
ncbi:MAG: polyphosphate polymerase domain-containing protein [Clostridia bacterium]